jgi:hypothetical protein
MYPDTALIASNYPTEDDAEHGRFLGDIVDEAAYITKEETVLLSINDIVLINYPPDHEPQTANEIVPTDKPIVVNGVQKDAAGVRVNMEGKLGDIGTVYYSKDATANILSMSTLVDSGATVKYYHSANRFTVQPKGSKIIYSFCRKNIPGNESKFYVYNMDSMVNTVPTLHPSQEGTFVTTVADNLVHYTKREVLGASEHVSYSRDSAIDQSRTQSQCSEMAQGSMLLLMISKLLTLSGDPTSHLYEEKQLELSQSPLMRQQGCQ